MRLFRTVNDLPEFKHGVLTIGTFDGVHQGHQQIIERINQEAKQNGGESILLTFHPHPRLVINPNDTSLKLLNTLDEKIALLEQYGVDNLIIAPFSREFSQLTAEQYVNDFLLGQICPAEIVIGYDHKFGNDRRGDIDLLRSIAEPKGVKVEEISKQTVDDIAVSSTKVRKALQNRDVEKANSLMGHNYVIHGTVVHGKKNGRKIGYPTANVETGNPNKLIPANGVYVAKVEVDGQKLGGMLSVGTNPTFDGTEQTIEVHIFDMNSDIYGKDIAIEFIASIREEKKFSSVEALVEQMKEDERISRKMLY